MSTGMKAKIIFIVFLLLLGGIARFYGLDIKSLWRDEIETYVIAAEDYSQLTELSLEIPYIPVPPLYFYITRFINFQLFENLSLRWPAALFGILLIPAVWLLGKEVAFSPAAETGAALVCLSPFFIRYSQEARSYTLLALLAVMSLFFLMRAVRDGRMRDWTGFCAATILALYTHHFAILLLAAEVVYYIFERLRSADSAKEKLIKVISAWPVGLIITAAYLPMIRYLLRGIRGPRGLDTSVMQANFHISDIPALLSVIGPADSPWMWIVAALALAGVIAGAQWRPGGRRLVIISIVLPLLLAFILPFKHALRIRYLIYIVPAYYMIAAVGLAWMIGRSGKRYMPLAGIGIICLVALASSISGVRDYFREGNQDWKSAAGFLERVSGPGDVILVDGRGEKKMNLRFRVLDYYSGLGPKVRIIDPHRDSEAWIETGKQKVEKFWYINTMTEKTAGPEKFLPDKGTEFRKYGWRSLPPIKFDAPAYESDREIWWIGPTRYRSILIFPIVRNDTDDAVDYADLLEEAKRIPQAVVDEDYEWKNKN